MSTHLAHNASVGPLIVPVGIDIVVFQPGTSIAGGVEIGTIAIAIAAIAGGLVLANCTCSPLEQSHSCCGTVIARRVSQSPRGQ